MVLKRKFHHPNDPLVSTFSSLPPSWPRVIPGLLIASAVSPFLGSHTAGTLQYAAFADCLLSLRNIHCFKDRQHKGSPRPRMLVWHTIKNTKIQTGFAPLASPSPLLSLSFLISKIGMPLKPTPPTLLCRCENRVSFLKSGGDNAYAVGCWVD